LSSGDGRDLQRSQIELKEAAKLAGDLPRVYNSLAGVFERRRLKQEARRAYRKFLNIDPGQE